MPEQTKRGSAHYVGGQLTTRCYAARVAAAAKPSCLNENEVLSLLRGSFAGGRQEAARAHIDGCSDCQGLLACLLDASAAPGEGEAQRPSSAGRSLQGRSIGRYRVREVIGAGAMGIVYLAEDPELHRTVAVKVHRGRDAASSERLLREARALARLSHPNVIVVHEVGTFEDDVFMAMEYVDGGSLTSWLASEARGTTEILDVFLQAGRGLSVAHTAGLVHRDFKPDNVLVGRDGRVRVVDFGLAREEPRAPLERSVRSVSALDRAEPGGETLTRTGTVVGTPAYMAPEQYAGQRADARSDQFAFAVALFEALYGQRPFAGDTFAMLERAVSSGEISIPRATRRIPAPVRKALLRSLRLRPEARFASMDELLRALTRKERRQRVVGAIGAAVLASAAVVGATRTWQRAPTPTATPPTATEEHAVLAAPPEPRSAAAPPIAIPTTRAIDPAHVRATPTTRDDGASPRGAKPSRAKAPPLPATVPTVPTVLTTERDERGTSAPEEQERRAEDLFDVRR